MSGARVDTDRYGQPVTAASPTAVRRYADFLDRFLAFDSSISTALDRALAADPDFALTHAARAVRALLLGHRPRRRPPRPRGRSGSPRACPSASRAWWPAWPPWWRGRGPGRLPPQTRAWWPAWAAVVAGEGPRAVGLLHRHLEAYPRDLLAVQLAVQALGALGGGASGDADPRLALLEPLEPDLVRLGGSNEQRDAFTDTVVTALLRAGRSPDAEARLRTRLTPPRRRPGTRCGSPRSWPPPGAARRPATTSSMPAPVRQRPTRGGGRERTALARLADALSAG